MLVIVLGLVAAALNGGGFVCQQHAAATAPAEDRLSLRILLDLLPRPVWLGGILATAAADVIGAAALAHGNITLVEPLLASNLLFALAVSAAWSGRSLGLREWGGAVMMVLGLALFVFAAAPEGDERAAVPLADWLISGVSIAALAAILIWIAQRGDLARQATLLAAAGGLLFGLQDALTRSALLLLGRGVPAMLEAWQPYAVIAVAIAGLVLTQSAFEAAPLAASLPALTLSEPLAGIALGVGIFSEALRVTPLALAGEAVSLLAMAVGVILVARSPMITERCAPA